METALDQAHRVEALNHRLGSRDRALMVRNVEAQISSNVSIILRGMHCQLRPCD
jgi:hypothetical protein